MPPTGPFLELTSLLGSKAFTGTVILAIFLAALLAGLKVSVFMIPKHGQLTTLLICHVSFVLFGKTMILNPFNDFIISGMQETRVHVLF